MDKKNDKIFYISVNNWGGEDAPDIPFFRNSYDNPLGFGCLLDDEYCEKNKICVIHGPVDMSTEYCISAPREWVEKNCPEFLESDQYDKFLFNEDDKGLNDVYWFPEYCEKNFRSEFRDYWWDNEDEW